jgi:hypothetical protein
MNCWHCGTEIDARERIGFRAQCPSCDRDLHVCRNCEFYDPSYNNQCRETSAERVVEKERFNFCEYFSPSHASTRKAPAATVSARDKLDALFRKKS